MAWHDARLLWRVREHASMRAHYERALDEATALAGRCLLVPVEVRMTMTVTLPARCRHRRFRH